MLHPSTPPEGATCRALLPQQPGPTVRTVVLVLDQSGRSVPLDFCLAASDFTFIGVRPRSICSGGAGARKSFGSLRRNLQLPTRNRSGETIDGRAVPETSRGAIKPHEQNRTAAASGARQPPPDPPPSPLPHTHDAMDHGEAKGGSRNPPSLYTFL